MDHIELVREFSERVILFEGDAEFTLRVPQKDAPVPMDIVYRGYATKIVHAASRPCVDSFAHAGVLGDDELARAEREFERADPGSVRMTVRITSIESVGAARLTGDGGKLECGHPDECWNDEHKGDQYCEWCQQVQRLERHCRSLRAQLGKMAVFVTGGEPHLTLNEPLGMLSIEGGNVTIEGEPAQIDTLVVERGANVGSK